MKKNEALAYNAISQKVYDYAVSGKLDVQLADYRNCIDKSKNEIASGDTEALKKVVAQVIESEVIQYYANLEVMPIIENCETAMQVLAESQNEWEALPCDPEGASKEQEEQQDNFLSEIVESVAECLEIKDAMK